MKLALILASLAPLFASAELARPQRPEPCHGDAAVVGGEGYRLASAHGSSQSIDGIGCIPGGGSYTAGAARFEVAGSRWNVGRAGYAAPVAADWWGAAEITAGSGRGASGAFDYLTLREAVTSRVAPRAFVRVEHQYIDIAGSRGHLAKLAASVIASGDMLLELSGLRSFGGNLGTRGGSARADYLWGRARWYGGVAWVRATPQAVEIVTGARLADAVTREAFVGSAVTFAWGELLAAVDTQRTAAVRRETFSLAVRRTFR